MDPPAGQDSYHSLEDGPEIETHVRASRFIARAFHVRNEALASDRIASVHRIYHDARHVCWGLRLAPPEAPVERCDNAREPPHTAGPPIVAALQGAGLLDALVVVTRYFGGTRLGTGGLIRAYGEAAAAAVAAAPRQTVWRLVRLDVSCSYDELGVVEGLLARFGDAIAEVSRDFSAGPRLQVQVRRSRAAALRQEIRNVTRGRADLT